METKTANSTKSNFGAKGWLMILVAGLMFYFYAGMCTDGLNTIVSSFANAHQVDEAALLSMTTPASWVGLLGSVACSWAIAKFKSNRVAMLITAVLGMIAYDPNATVMTDAAKSGVKFLFIGVFTLIMLASLIPLLFFRLNDKKVIEMEKDIAKRKASA